MLNDLVTGNKKSTYFLLTNSIEPVSYETSALFLSFDDTKLYIVVRKKTNHELLLVKVINIVYSLEKTLENEKFIDQSWGSVYFVDLKQLHSIVPKQFVTDNLSSNLLLISEDGSIDSSSIEFVNNSSESLSFISASNLLDVNILKQFFSQISIINSLEVRNQTNELPFVQNIHLHDSSLSIIVYKNSQIDFQNTFEVSNLEEVAYFCIFTLKKHKILPSDCSVTINADKKIFLKLEELLAQYVKDVSKQNLDIDVSADMDISNVYFPFNAYKCIF